MADPTKFKVYAPINWFISSMLPKVVWAAVFQLAGAALWACSSATFGAIASTYKILQTDS